MKTVKYCQGDVYFVPAKLPKGAKRRGDTVLAHGEATGHAHTAENGLAVYEHDGTLYIGGPGTVHHQEHGEIAIDDEVLRVGRVREYDYFDEEARRVKD